MTTLMIVGAHAGDAENMGGAIAAKYSKAGHKVILVHMSMGERGNPKLTDKEYYKMKKREALKVSEALGAEPVFLNYADGEVPDSNETREAVCELIRTKKPDIVLTHWRGSFHKDHIATHKVVSDAVFLASLPGFKAILKPHAVKRVYWAENWEDEEDFRVDVLIDVSDSVQTWRNAILNYSFARGETGFNYIEYYTSVMRAHGLRAGCEYAVALMHKERLTIKASWIPVKFNLQE
jgi:LmbE family N-acetylglucosaminyl deacetylase